MSDAHERTARATGASCRTCATRAAAAQLGPADDDAPARRRRRGPRRWRRSSASATRCSSPPRPAGCSKPPPRELNGADPDSDDARLVARHPPAVGEGAPRADRARRRDGARRLARPGGLGRRRARASDFDAFAPYLERNFELARRYVDCFDGFECAYDVLLDDYEPGMKTRRGRAAVRRAEGRARAADRHAGRQQRPCR